MLRVGKLRKSYAAREQTYKVELVRPPVEMIN